jgi:hypothetical protein
MTKYQIVWAIFRPVKGKFFNKNYNEIYNSGVYSIGKRAMFNEAIAHFNSKEIALEAIRNVHVSKDFEVVLITDAQFGRASYDAQYWNVATELQKQSKITISAK